MVAQGMAMIRPWAFQGLVGMRAWGAGTACVAVARANSRGRVGGDSGDIVLRRWRETVAMTRASFFVAGSPGRSCRAVGPGCACGCARSGGRRVVGEVRPDSDHVARQDHDVGSHVEPDCAKTAKARPSAHVGATIPQSRQLACQYRLAWCSSTRVSEATWEATQVTSHGKEYCKRVGHGAS